MACSDKLRNLRQVTIWLDKDEWRERILEGNETILHALRIGSSSHITWFAHCLSFYSDENPDVQNNDKKERCVHKEGNDENRCEPENKKDITITIYKNKRNKNSTQAELLDGPRDSAFCS